MALNLCGSQISWSIKEIDALDHDLARPPFFFGLPDFFEGFRFGFAVIVAFGTWLWNRAMSQAAAGPGGVSAR